MTLTTLTFVLFAYGDEQYQSRCLYQEQIFGVNVLHLSILTSKPSQYVPLKRLVAVCLLEAKSYVSIEVRINLIMRKKEQKVIMSHFSLGGALDGVNVEQEVYPGLTVWS